MLNGQSSETAEKRAQKMLLRFRMYFVFLLGMLVLSSRRAFHANRIILRSNAQLKESENWLKSSFTPQNPVAFNRTSLDNLMGPITSRDCVTCSRTLECERWLPGDVVLSTNQNPSEFQSTHTKYLLPWLYNGPNNQLFGLRQAAYVAVRLNRTLVLPLFHKHFTDGNGYMERIDANHRFNVASLASLIPVASLTEFKRHCSRQPDVMFLSSSMDSEWTVSQLKLAEQKLDLDILSKADDGNTLTLQAKDRLKMPFLPKNHAYRMDSSQESIVNNFGTDETCAVYALPFRAISFPKLDRHKDNVPQNISEQSVEGDLMSLSDGTLNLLIAKATQLPSYVKEIAHLFAERVISNRRYSALHWRYDKEDFYKFMCVPGGNPQNKHNRRNLALTKMCSAVASIDARRLGRSIYDYLTRNVSVAPYGDVVNLYVASPPSALHWLMDGLEQDERLPIRFYNSKHLRQFLSSEMIFKRCEFLNTNLEDFVSLVETQLCIDGQVFVRSSYSSWSDNVSLARKLYSGQYQRCDRRIQSLAFG